MTDTAPIAALGSPSDTTELTIDVLDVARDERLVGSMLCLETQQDGRPMRITGQVTGISLRNRWHEQDAMRNIIKSSGALPHLSGRQDVRTASLSVGAVFSCAEEGVWRNDILGSVPATGSVVKRLDQETLDELVAQQKEHLFYFGQAYGDRNVSLPMYLKHFGDHATGGQGEAHHALIVGKTGSGKSTLAKMMLAGYARHAEMAVLVIDPKGEFSDEISGYQVGDADLPLSHIMAGYGRRALRFGITQIQLQTWDLFKDIFLALQFHRKLNIKRRENGEEFAECLVEAAKSLNLNLSELRGRDNLCEILTRLCDPEEAYLGRIYKSSEPQDALRRDIQRAMQQVHHRVWAAWDFLTFLFSRGDGERPTIQRLVRDLVSSRSGERPFVALDLSVPGNRRDMEGLRDRFGGLEADDDGDGQDLFTDSLQKKIIFRIVSDMRRVAEAEVSDRHRQGDKNNVNTLVVFEEAHRYAPSHLPSEDHDGRRLKGKLIEAVRETRKFGLGWMFVDQTIGGIDKQITQQVRLAFFGFGLSMGNELERLREIAGGDQRDMDLYRSFKDPASYGGPDERQFPWMAVGPVSPMASNRPLFINAFSGAEFAAANQMPTADAPQRRIPKPAARPKEERRYKAPAESKSRTVERKPPKGLADVEDAFNFFRGTGTPPRDQQ